MRLSTNTWNIIYLFLGDISTRLLGFLATIYLARILGTSGFGVINIGLAVLAYAMIISDGGLKFLGIREVAGNSENLAEFSGSLISTRFILSLFTFAIGIMTTYFFVNSQELRSVISVFLLYIFPGAFMLEWYFQGKKQMGIAATGRFLGMLIYLLFILVFVSQISDLVNIAWGWIFGVFINAALLWIIFLNKKYFIRFQWQPHKFKILFKTALPLGIATIMSQVVLQFPPIYIGLIATTSDVGIYSAAFKLTAMILIFDRVFYAIFLPTISHHFQNKPENLSTIFNHVLKFISTLSLFVGLCAILSANFLIKIIFSNDFVDAVPVFQIMVGYFIFSLISSVFTFTLIGMKLEKIYTKSLLAGVLVFVFSILILGKPFGTQGAALSIVLYILTSLTIMTVGLKPYIPMNLIRSMVLPVAATLFIFLPILMLLHLALPLKLIIVTVICLPAISWLCGFRTNEIAYLKRVLIWN